MLKGLTTAGNICFSVWLFDQLKRYLTIFSSCLCMLSLDVAHLQQLQTSEALEFRKVGTKKIAIMVFLMPEQLEWTCWWGISFEFIECGNGMLHGQSPELLVFNTCSDCFCQWSTFNLLPWARASRSTMYGCCFDGNLLQCDYSSLKTKAGDKGYILRLFIQENRYYLLPPNHLWFPLIYPSNCKYSHLTCIFIDLYFLSTWVAFN